MVRWQVLRPHIEDRVQVAHQDRMEVTGARLASGGASTARKPSSASAPSEGNGHFDEYFDLHLRQQKQRDHDSRYQ